MELVRQQNKHGTRHVIILAEIINARVTARASAKTAPRLLTDTTRLRQIELRKSYSAQHGNNRCSISVKLMLLLPISQLRTPVFHACTTDTRRPCALPYATIRMIATPAHYLLGTQHCISAGAQAATSIKSVDTQLGEQRGTSAPCVLQKVYLRT